MTNAFRQPQCQICFTTDRILLLLQLSEMISGIIFVWISVFILHTRANVFHLTNCIDMAPSDLTTAEQTSLQPFRVMVSTTEYEEGEPVKVVLSGTDASTTFIDFLLQARCLTCSNQSVPVGAFSIPAGQPPSEILSCYDTLAAVTASSLARKTSLTFTWLPPDGFSDVVIMRATFVRNRTLWWGNVVSQTMNAMSVPLRLDAITTLAFVRPTTTVPPYTHVTSWSSGVSPYTTAKSSFQLTLWLLLYRRLVF